MKKGLLLILLFTSLSIMSFAQITTVGIIGSGTPGGWDADTDMTQDAGDTAIWTITVVLTANEVKFRANDDWAINWGSGDFPNGTGVQEGSNIPVVSAGEYFVTLNTTTGEYSFVIDSPVGIIGDATPNGWDVDTNMFKDSTDHGFFIDLELTVGEAKFRLDDDWATNWGSADFPSGTGVQEGANILVDKAGFYHITLDTASGNYNFTELILFETISLIGSATPGGWDADTDLTQDSNNPDLWSTDITLVDGELKFRADHDWDTSWGGTDFPSGIASATGGNIAATEGNYRVTFNTETLEYSFLTLADYTTIGIIGSATPGGWDADTDMIKDPEDGTIWRLSVELVDGEAKFRAEDDWATNWGGADFPTGTGVQEGANIPVTAGRYNIVLNSLTGEYSFESFVVYDQISIVGKDGPFGQWPDETSDFDMFLSVDENDDQIWTGTDIQLTTADTTLGDSGIKFRANAAWDANWGDSAFPEGIATQDGSNIRCTEGIWDVVINIQSGEYIFELSTDVKDLLSPSSIKLYPNPAQDYVQIDLKTIDYTGTVDVQVFDMSGKTVKSFVSNSTELLKVNIADLNTGNYLIRLTNESYIIAKRFAISR